MERAEQEVVARRARRVLWAMRVVFYGGAAVAAALLLTGGDDGGTTFLEGRTAQGHHVTIRLDDGRPVAVGTYFSARCVPALEWSARWWALDGQTARFQFDDGVLGVREKLSQEYDDEWSGERDYTLEARLADGRASGTIRLVENLRHPSGVSYVCESDAVAFSARPAA